ncbi:hypothetical protein N7519_007903 [Penicillium mononematosum]|uniref:uncharacterized protein n=1 Tax=Penicillium mononematosum TaxID=268346 RepID=UPI0025472251|nr:uncharacterized protein N7519_007903 [Penicillium mononematosum]KAJ6186602.1 hypothetical protein N7519_007903 [Penicillium mononematosum]
MLHTLSPKMLASSAHAKISPRRSLAANYAVSNQPELLQPKPFNHSGTIRTTNINGIVHLCSNKRHAPA